MKKNIFNKVADTYDEDEPRIFRLFAEKLVDSAEITEGEKVLDLATGKGAIIRQISHAPIELHAIDSSFKMLEKITKSAFYRSEYVFLKQMDCHRLEYKSKYFDHIFCAFSIFLFEHPQRVIEQVKRVLKPSGTFYMSTWLKDENNIFDQALTETGIEVSPFKFCTIEECSDFIRNNGFESVKAKIVEIVLFFENEDHWWNKQWTHGALDILQRLSHSQLQVLKMSLKRKLEKYRSDTGIHIPVRAIFTIGKK